MSECSDMDELIAIQKKEKKELLAKTQKMKHGVPKGDKKKKKEVTAEIAQLLADLDIKHENELKEFENKASSSTSGNGIPEASGIPNDQNTTSSLENGVISEEEIVHCEVEEEEESSNKGNQRMSKAQKRRNKKALALKEREKAIAEQEVENLTSLRHLESEEIKKKLSERNLSIHEVPSDGNCLYKAVEHQLSLHGKEITAQSLRERTSQYMLNHIKDYISFLTNPETGDALSEEEYKTYCEDIARTSAWGGHIEIQVLSQICEMPIEVIQAKGPSVFAGDENRKPRLMLSYHRHVYGLGEHYNSVVPIADN